MSLPVVFIYLAGAIILVHSTANLFAFRKFGYLEHLRNVPQIVRQVFLVQNGYLTFVQVGLAALCFGFAGELASGRGLGLAISAYLAAFWAVRVLLQLFYYDRDLRRANRLYDVLFLVGDGYLTAVFALAALLPLVPTS